MKIVDLHIHTTASDGCWTPHELVWEVKKAGLFLFAAADHDNIGSVEILERLAHDNNLNYIRGVEITSKLGHKACHILGYEIDPQNPALLKICRDNERRRERLNNEYVKQLSEAGLDVTLTEYNDYNFRRGRGGGRLANFLFDKGFYKTLDKSILSAARGTDWTRPDYPNPGEVVSVIRSSGGHAILAHPGSTLLGEALNDHELELIVDMGVEGIECYTNYHTADECRRYAGFCKKKSLLVTAGSDCHGPILKERLLGTPQVDIEDLNLTGIWPISGSRSP